MSGFPHQCLSIKGDNFLQGQAHSLSAASVGKYAVVYLPPQTVMLVMTFFTWMYINAHSLVVKSSVCMYVFFSLLRPTICPLTDTPPQWFYKILYCYFTFFFNLKEPERIICICSQPGLLRLGSAKPKLNLKLLKLDCTFLHTSLSANTFVLSGAGAYAQRSCWQEVSKDRISSLHTDGSALSDTLRAKNLYSTFPVVQLIHIKMHLCKCSFWDKCASFHD